jgi:transitional endoplasmic reticulum ATPase
VDLDKIAEKTDGYVGADIEGLVRESAMLALRENMNSKEVNKTHFEEAMKKMSASVSKEDLKRYEHIEHNYLKSAKAALERPHDKDREYLG